MSIPAGSGMFNGYRTPSKKPMSPLEKVAGGALFVVVVLPIMLVMGAVGAVGLAIRGRGGRVGGAPNGK